MGADKVHAGSTLTHALEEASLAIFASKNAGRNRVTVRRAHATPPTAGQ